jgi:hypothetical protein
MAALPGLHYLMVSPYRGHIRSAQALPLIAEVQMHRELTRKP